MKVRQPYGEPRIVPWLGDVTVNPGQVVTVPDADLPSYLEAGWQPADAGTRKAGEQLLADGVITVLNVPAPAEAPADVKES